MNSDLKMGTQRTDLPRATSGSLSRSFLRFAAMVLTVSVGSSEVFAQNTVPLPAARSTLGAPFQQRGSSGQPKAQNDEPVILSEFAIPSGPTAYGNPGQYGIPGNAPPAGMPIPGMPQAAQIPNGLPQAGAGSTTAQPPKQVWLKENNGEWSTQLLLRKVVRIDGPVAGQVFVSGKEPYQVFCNGRTVGEGDGSSGVQAFDVSEHLRHGDNVIAIQSRRETSDAPGVGLRFQYNTSLSRQTVETDGTWLAAKRALPLWKTHLYSDRNWDEAAVVTALPARPANLPSDQSLPVPALLAGRLPGQFPGNNVPVAQAPVADSMAGTAASNASQTPERSNPITATRSGVKIAQGKPAPKDAVATSLGDHAPAVLTTEAAEPNVADNATTAPAEQSTSLVANSDQAMEATKDAVTPVPSVEQSPVDQELVAKASQKIYPSTSATKLVETGLTPTAETGAPDAKSADAETAVASNQEPATGATPTAGDTQVAQTPFLDQTSAPEVAATGFAEPSSANPVPVVTAAAEDDSIRLRVPENFIVEPIASSEIGSLIAIEFDEFGRLIASREKGGLVRINLGVPIEDPRRVVEICNEMSAVQGILPLNGTLFVSGLGPEGMGLYKLTDSDGNDQYETIEKFCSFSGEPGEHGPHAIDLGPDRMLYVLLGNHSQIEGDLSPASLIHNFYEGDLLPRYEDPSGHAAGIKAPGGMLLRISLDGQQKEVVAAGLRNAYDFAFNSAGEIFFHDSDMESDEGTSWYRPTQLYHLIGGGDYGWRSGWAKWRSYYPDAIEPIARTGRSSPSGSAYYQHVQFPAEYRDSLFLADWSNGRIVSAKLKRDGAGYDATLTTFMEGRPLNVTDLSVGPQDGALYIALGGRDSTGGIYRVRWTGKVASELTTYNNGWEEVIRAPLFYSAATRQRIATLKQSLGNSWDDTMRSIVTSEKNVDAYRLRGLDVLQWFGPTPDIALLRQLSATKSEPVRAKTATILGTHQNDEAVAVLTGLLEDASPLVQRCACESLCRLSATVPVDRVLPLLESSDRNVAYVASRLLEKQPLELWRDQLASASSNEQFVRLAITLMTVEPELANSYKILVGISQRWEAAVEEQQQLDLLRVTQLALGRSEVSGDKIPVFVQQMADQFPSPHSRVNRELVYVLAYLKPAGLDEKYAAYLGDEEIEFVDRLHLAMHVQLAGESMSEDLRRQTIEFLEDARNRDAGGSYAHYVMQAVRNLAKHISPESAKQWIAKGELYPDAALLALGKLPKPVGLAEVIAMDELDQKLTHATDPASRDLRLGIVAILGEALDSEVVEVQNRAAGSLERIWEADPNRRQWVAVAVTHCQQAPEAKPVAPEEENAALRLASEARTKLRPVGLKPIYIDRFNDLMIKSLPYLTGDSATEVLESLQSLNQASKNPLHIRSIILLGLQYPSTAPTADQLLTQWTGTSHEVDSPAQAMAYWQSWFQQRYPDQLPASLPSSDDAGKWTVADIEKQLELLKGDVLRGQQVFVDARCASCHKVGNIGSSVGPDLNVVSGRFTRREILEAIVHPSQVISDQYRSSVIQTEDGKVRTGIVSTLPGAKIAILDSEGNRTEISRLDVEAVSASDQSIMPARLLENFNAQQVVDLIRFLESEDRPTIASADQTGEADGETRR